VRLEAIKALGTIGPAARPAVPELVKRMDYASPDIRAAAGAALERIDPDAAAALHRRPYVIGLSVAACVAVAAAASWYWHRRRRRLRFALQGAL
jgi:hypothetical protein